MRSSGALAALGTVVDGAHHVAQLFLAIAAHPRNVLVRGAGRTTQHRRVGRTVDAGLLDAGQLLFNALPEASVVQAVGDHHVHARKMPQPADQSKSAGHSPRGSDGWSATATTR